MEDILWHLDSPIRRMRVQAIRRIAAVVPSVDEALVDWALTAPGDWQVRNSEDNERLEFLGDAVLEVVVTETVHRAFPRKKTGSLQRVVGHVVSNRSLKVISRALELHGGLISGKKRAGDAVEALVAAAYAGGGFPAAREVVARLFDPLIVEGAEMKLVGLDWNGMLFRIARELGVGGISIAVHDGAGSKVQCTITAANESLPLGEAMAKTRWTAERQASALAYLALSRRKPWGLKVAVAQTYVSEGIEKAAVLVGQAFDPMVAEGVETRLVVDWKERLSKLEARDGVLDLAITNEVCSVFGETSFLCRVTVPSRNVSVEAVQATLADAERRAAALAYLALARTANWKSVSMIADRVANIR
ncbi:ribonuclease III domain-containing protein [Hyaloraphidium curvatum]|nr:ribonuclease III domain-containing protein [Hyaloraphidium curvatum]